MKQKIDVADLRIGMYIVEIDRPWLDTPFLFQGFPVESQKDIDCVQRTCHYVYIDSAQAETFQSSKSPENNLVRHSATEKAISLLSRKSEYQNQVTFIEEFKPARAVRFKAKAYLEGIFDDIRLGQSVDTEGAKSVVRSMVDSITRNPDASLWYTQLRKMDEYTADHSLNVCILTLVFGRHLNFTESVLNELGIGALLHDIGKIRIPANIINKPGPLTKDELALVRKHPSYGAEILKQSPGVPQTAVDIALCHHERVDGEGYPQGLKAGELSLFSKMVAVVDVYDAITSNRVYHHGMSPSDALKNMYQWQHTDFDESLVEDFIQCLGIYPVGSAVQFNTGEIGIIMNDNKEHRLKPTVMLVLDAQQNPIFPEHIVNLASNDENHSGTVRQIKKVFGPDERPFGLTQHILTDLTDVNVA